jgi:hypothetical protein
LKTTISGRVDNRRVCSNKIKTENTTQNTYQLYTTDNTDISATIKAQSETELSYLKRVGKKFPDFNFTDLNGQNITSLNTKGKHIIIKTWFINCTAVKEISGIK